MIIIIVDIRKCMYAYICALSNQFNMCFLKLRKEKKETNKQNIGLFHMFYWCSVYLYRIVVICINKFSTIIIMAKNKYETFNANKIKCGIFLLNLTLPPWHDWWPVMREESRAISLQFRHFLLFMPWSRKKATMDGKSQMKHCFKAICFFRKFFWSWLGTGWRWMASKYSTKLWNGKNWAKVRCKILP